MFLKTGALPALDLFPQFYQIPTGSEVTAAVSAHKHSVVPRCLVSWSPGGFSVL